MAEGRLSGAVDEIRATGVAEYVEQHARRPGGAKRAGAGASRGGTLGAGEGSRLASPAAAGEQQQQAGEAQQMETDEQEQQQGGVAAGRGGTPGVTERQQGQGGEGSPPELGAAAEGGPPQGDAVRDLSRPYCPWPAACCLCWGQQDPEQLVGCSRCAWGRQEPSASAA